MSGISLLCIGKSQLMKMLNQARGDSVNPKRAEEVIDKIEDIIKEIEPYGTFIEPSKKKFMAKCRPGVESQIPLLVSLAERYGVKSTRYPLSQFPTDVELVKNLGTIENPAMMLHALLTDSIYAIRSRYFSALSATYRALQSLARSEPDLAAEMAPLKEFFAVTRPKKEPKSSAPTLGMEPGGDE